MIRAGFQALFRLFTKAFGDPANFFVRGLQITDCSSAENRSYRRSPPLVHSRESQVFRKHMLIELFDVRIIERLQLGR